MHEELPLKSLTEASIFAVIYGFYIQGKEYYGELTTLEKRCMCSETALLKYIKHLLAENLITKEQTYSKGYVKRYKYSIVE
mgnify:CR=1 FL=1